MGRGQLLWCPLPVELNYRPEALIALYRLAIDRAGVEPELEWLAGGNLPGVYGRKIGYAHGALYVFVSEYGHPAEIQVRDPASGAIYTFTLESDRSVLFTTDTQGGVRSVYRPDQVQITVS